MKINIYSPVNGEIKNIEDCKDAMFADRMLGDGFVVIPEKNDFKAFFDEAKVTMVFDTKHAYGFDIKGLQFLLHCGMDTVNLKGEGFSTTLKVGDILKKGDNLFSMDIDFIKKSNLSIETPIVFEINNLSKYKIKDLKTGKVNQGDLICIIEFEFKNVQEEITRRSIEDPMEFFNVQNKYQTAAIEINRLVGTKANYQEVYNCMTRLRFTIKNKNLVNINELKSHPMIKGVVWNGNEIQIVIGQDVYKLKDEVIKLNNEAIQDPIAIANKQKISLLKRFFAMFSGIMIRLIPVMIGTGLVQALITIFMQAGLMPEILLKMPPTGLKDNQVLIGNAPIGWAILFITGRVTGYFMGVMIAVSASSYFKLDLIIGVGIGLILCAPILYLDGGPKGLGFEKVIWNIKDVKIEGQPVLTALLDNFTKIKINAMNTKIFVIIPSIFMAKKLDSWIKTWLPISLDLIIRPFFIILLISFVAFFPLGIAWNFVEALFGLITFYLAKIPLGIGIGIYTAFYQIAVLFGTHVVLFIIGTIDSYLNGGQTIFIVGIHLSVWAQLGALIGVIIVTRDAKLRKQGIQMLPAGIIGVTEPILYGINLPKKRPLIAGVMAAFFAGSIANVLNITSRAGSGLGIFALIGFFAEPILGGQGILTPIQNGLYNILVTIIALALGILFSLLIYKERKTEKTLLKNMLDQSIMLSKLQLNLNDQEINALKNSKKEILNLIDKDTLKTIKETEKQIQKYISINQKINSIKENEEAYKEKLMIKGKKLISKNKIEKSSNLIKKYNLIINENIKKINKLEIKKDEYYNLIDFNKLNQSLNKIEIEIINKIKKLNYIDEQLINKLGPIIFNSLNSLQIHYGLIDKKETELDLKKLIQNEKELLKQTKLEKQKIS